jgi:hypothetical protein
MRLAMLPLLACCVWIGLLPMSVAPCCNGQPSTGPRSADRGGSLTAPLAPLSLVAGWAGDSAPRSGAGRPVAAAARQRDFRTPFRPGAAATRCPARACNIPPRPLPISWWGSSASVCAPSSGAARSGRFSCSGTFSQPDPRQLSWTGCSTRLPGRGPGVYLAAGEGPERPGLRLSALCRSDPVRSAVVDNDHLKRYRICWVDSCCI